MNMNNFHAALPTILLLAGSVTPAVAGQQQCDSRNFDEVTLKPGCPGTCVQQPCAISFTLPTGSGEYTITDGHFVLGKARGGETIYLGSFWQGVHRFETTDASGQQLPTSHLSVSGEPD
jgi:hypothetical protein